MDFGMSSVKRSKAFENAGQLATKQWTRKNLFDIPASLSGTPKTVVGGAKPVGESGAKKQQLAARLSRVLSS
jgi:hypothetical protein